MGVVLGKRSPKSHQRKSSNLSTNLSENENLAALKNYALISLKKTNESVNNIFAYSNKMTFFSEKPSKERSFSVNKFEKPHFTPLQRVPDFKKTAFEKLRAESVHNIHFPSSNLPPLERKSIAEEFKDVQLPFQLAKKHPKNKSAQKTSSLSDIKNFKSGFDLDCCKTQMASKSSLFSEMKQIYSERELKEFIAHNTPKNFNYTPSSFLTAMKRNSFEKSLNFTPNSVGSLKRLNSPQAEISVFSPNRGFISNGMPLNLKGKFSEEAQNNMKIVSFNKNPIFKEKTELFRSFSLKTNSKKVLETIKGLESFKTQSNEAGLTNIKIRKILKTKKGDNIINRTSSLIKK